MILGLVLAGGKSSRFGSDKALAEFDGHTLLARAVDTLSGYCEFVVVVGRQTAPAPCIPDWPHPDLGPLGGIAAGLHHALDVGFESVLTCGVDSLELPDDLAGILSPPPAFLASQPVVGHWPATAAGELEKMLTETEDRSVFAFCRRIGARPVEIAVPPANINTPGDLAAAVTRRERG